MNDMMDLGTVEYNITCQSNEDVIAIIATGLGNYDALYDDDVSASVVT